MTSCNLSRRPASARAGRKCGSAVHGRQRVCSKQWIRSTWSNRHCHLQHGASGAWNSKRRRAEPKLAPQFPTPGVRRTTVHHATHMLPLPCVPLSLLPGRLPTWDACTQCICLSRGWVVVAVVRACACTCAWCREKGTGYSDTLGSCPGTPSIHGARSKHIAACSDTSVRCAAIISTRRR